jgi:hypothetical protein
MYNPQRAQMLERFNRHIHADPFGRMRSANISFQYTYLLLWIMKFRC